MRTTHQCTSLNFPLGRTISNYESISSVQKLSTSSRKGKTSSRQSFRKWKLLWKLPLESVNCKYWFWDRTWHCGVHSVSLVETSLVSSIRSKFLSRRNQPFDVMTRNRQSSPFLLPFLLSPFLNFIRLKQKFLENGNKCELNWSFPESKSIFRVQYRR